MKKPKFRYVAVMRRVIVTKKVARCADKRGNVYRVIKRRKDIETVHVAVLSGKEVGDEA